MRQILAILPIIAMCYGCQTPEQKAAERNAQQDALCKSFGANPGTDAYLQCRLTLAQQAASEDAQRRALAAQFLLNNRPVYQPPQPSPAINCTSSPVGRSVQTTCY